MSYGEKQPFCAGKPNLNQIKSSCAQTGYSQKWPFCAKKKQKIDLIRARKPKN